jgi:NhaA family Na+:H+ antiporter
MSLFIATLAFDGTGWLDSAKIGVFAASLLAGLIGALGVRGGLQKSYGELVDTKRTNSP